MDTDDIKQNWPRIKTRLQEKYPTLTEEDLKYEIGKEGELLERLKAKLDKNWKEIKNVLSLLG